MKPVWTLFVAVVLLSPPATLAQDRQVYKVTVTNITPGQILSPPVVVSHNARVSLFEPGTPASAELAAVAEDADSAGLVALLMTTPGVEDVSVGTGPIPPGGSLTIEVRTRGRRNLISLASMLVTTNDSFAGARGLRVHPTGTVTAVVPAYDAGSERNNELCAFIPGPPCNNPGVRDTDGAEGFVHVSYGIQGVGDLDGASDWRNPVAAVSVTRVR